MEKTLPEMFRDAIISAIAEHGVHPMPLLARHRDGRLSFASLAISPLSFFETAHERFIGDPTVEEVVFGYDRSAAPGQETRHSDVVTMLWWRRGHDRNHGWRWAVIDYDPRAGVVEPTDWDNAFWNAVLEGEVDRLVASVAAGPKPI